MTKRTSLRSRSTPQNRRTSGRGRAAGSLATQFKPGESGNLGGRPRALRCSVQDKVAADNLVDFWRLVAFGSDGEIREQFGTTSGPRWSDRMTAVVELADRGFGKPGQTDDQTMAVGEVTQLFRALVRAVRRHARDPNVLGRIDREFADIVRQTDLLEAS